MSAPLPCPVCDATDSHPFVRREEVPVHQHTLLSTPQAARGIARGSLTMCACARCGFVFNAEFDPALLDYGAAYDNSQNCSPAFDHYLDETVAHLVDRCGVRGSRIVEVGCGKGGFLRKLVADRQHGNTGVGFDPSYLGPASESDGRLRFVTRYFDGQGLDVAPDVVVCRHVIEHVARPVAFLQTIDAALRAAGSKRARVFFETPCVEWILRNQVIWDFFYEHCSLFTAASLALAFRRAGMAVSNVKHLFGGQYLWLEAEWTADGAAFVNTHPDAGDIVDRAEEFAAAECEQRSAWRAALERLRENGPVAVWGGGAKGVTFAGLVDPAGEMIDCVVDVNPAKQGRFLPGTGHPLVAPAALAERGVSAAVVLNSNYADEIRATLRELGSRVAVVDLMDAVSPIA